MRLLHRDERGMTLIELMVALAVFSAVSLGIYAVLFSGVRGATATEAGVDVSSEARLGFNRLTRDVREATSLLVPSGDTALGPDRFSIGVDFNRDGDTADTGEVETFTYDEDNDRITLSVDLNADGDSGDAGETETLIEGVEEIGGTDVFRYSSNFLEFDHNPADGIATCAEVADPPSGRSGGDGGACDAAELPFLTSVDFSFEVSSGSGATARGEEVFGQAQLRNRR